VSEIGLYQVVVEAAIETAAGQTLKTNFTFKIDLKSDCTQTSLIDQAVDNMTIRVGMPASSQLLTTFKDSIGESQSTNKDAYCGIRQYSLTPQPSFLKMQDLKLTLQTDDPADEGETIVTLKVELKDYSSTVVALSKQFTVKVICEVQKVTLAPFNTSQVSFKIKVDKAPLIIDYSLSYAPLCNDCLDIELSPSPPPFV